MRSVQQSLDDPPHCGATASGAPRGYGAVDLVPRSGSLDDGLEPQRCCVKSTDPIDKLSQRSFVRTDSTEHGPSWGARACSTLQVQRSGPFHRCSRPTPQSGFPIPGPVREQPLAEASALAGGLEPAKTHFFTTRFTTSRGLRGS